MNLLPKNPIKTLITIAYIAVAVLFVVFILPKAVTYFLPFILAWIISLIIKPIVRLLEKIHFSKRIAVISSMLIVIALLGYILFYLSAAVVNELQTIVNMLRQTSDGMPVFIKNILNSLPSGLRSFAFEFAERTEGDIIDFLYLAAQSALSKAGGAAGKLPSMFIFTVVLILATYFISFDSEKIKSELKKIIPKENLKHFRYIKDGLSKACGGYIRAQLILMSIVFCILLTGFLILDVKLSILLAAIISLLDAIPVLGTGMILNPWAIVCFIEGDYFRATGFVCLYLIVLFTRQFLEPRIISGQLGVHPLFTLAAMYVGLKTIGVSGLIFGPITLIIVINTLKVEAEFNGDGDESNE